MGVSRDSKHKKKANGGTQKNSWKKRKYESGRQPSNTTLSSTKRVKKIRVRGGNFKWRAISLNTGNFSFSSETITKRTSILQVVYNASGAHLVRTKKLVKGAIVEVDSLPYHDHLLHSLDHSIERELEENPPVGVLHTPNFTLWLQVNLRSIQLGPLKNEGELYLKKVFWYLDFLNLGKLKATIQNHIAKKRQFDKYCTYGKYLAKITSRPGQCGRADGYILEGDEFEFYMKKMGKSINIENASKHSLQSHEPDLRECSSCNMKLDSHFLQEHELWCLIVSRGITDIDCPEVFDFED